MTPGPAGAEQVRRLNTAHLLRSLRTAGPASRAELAVRTGLAKATVGTIVAELSERGVLAEEDATPGGRGRPGRPVVLRPGTVLGLGLEVNVEYVTAVTVDLGGTTHGARTVALGAGDDREAALAALARAVLADVTAEGGRVVAATLAVPGLVRTGQDSVAWAPNLGWASHAPALALEDALGVPVHVDNDANCAALAETSHGVAAGIAHALYLTGTVGIGAGVVEDGRLLRGGHGFAGEVGHMPIGDPAAVCGCGRHGCWEASVGLRAMLAAVDEPEHETPLTSAHAVAARAEREPAVRAALAGLGERLGHGLATLATILDPAVIVLGGYFTPLGRHLLPAAREVLEARVPSVELRPPDLRLSTLGIQAAALGAAEDALAGVLHGTVAV